MAEITKKPHNNLPNVIILGKGKCAIGVYTKNTITFTDLKKKAKIGADVPVEHWEEAINNAHTCIHIENIESAKVLKWMVDIIIEEYDE